MTKNINQNIEIYTFIIMLQITKLRKFVPTKLRKSQDTEI